MNKEELAKKRLKILIESAVEETIIQEQDVLYKAFVEPFTDVIKTAQHGLEQTISSVSRNARKVAMQTAAAAIPFIAPSEITRIGQDETERLKQKLGEIDSRYADVLDRNVKALQQKDVVGVAFLMNPAVTLGAHAGAWAAGKGVSGAGAAIAGNLEFLGLITAHVPVVGKMFSNLGQKFETLSQKASDAASAIVNKPIGSSGVTPSGGYGDMGDYGDFGESIQTSRNVLKEQQVFTSAQLNQKMGQVIQKLLNRKDVRKAISSSPITKTMKTTGIESVLNRANQVANFKTLDQFKHFAGPEFSKYEEQLKSKMPEDTSPEIMKVFEEQQVIELKKIYKQIYSKYLRELVGKTPGIAEEVNKALKELDKLS